MLHGSSFLEWDTAQVFFDFINHQSWKCTRCLPPTSSLCFVSSNLPHWANEFSSLLNVLLSKLLPISFISARVLSNLLSFYQLLCKTFFLPSGLLPKLKEYSPENISSSPLFFLQLLPRFLEDDLSHIMPMASPPRESYHNLKAFGNSSSKSPMKHLSGSKSTSSMSFKSGEFSFMRSWQQKWMKSLASIALSNMLPLVQSRMGREDVSGEMKM